MHEIRGGPPVIDQGDDELLPDSKDLRFGGGGGFFGLRGFGGGGGGSTGGLGFSAEGGLW